MQSRLDQMAFSRWPRGCWPTDRQRLLMAACLLADDRDARLAWDAWLAAEPLFGSDAASNHLLPLMLVRLEAWGGFEAEQRQIVGLVRYYWLFQQLLKRGLESALSTFADAGIDTLLLKGAALAAGTYRDGHRPMNDLDLLVRRDQAAAAIAALVAAGW
ncbi:MAG: nucleotidyltransferase family protein, partial [Planctomycetota bacterium]